MNERIKELARQAYVKDSLEHDPDWKQTEVYNCLMNGLDGFFEKFAELIVRECHDEVERYLEACGEITSLPSF